MSEETIVNSGFRMYLKARKLLSQGICLGPEDRDLKLKGLEVAREVLQRRMEEQQRKASCKVDSAREARRQFDRVARLYEKDFATLDKWVKELEEMYE